LYLPETPNFLLSCESINQSSNQLINQSIPA
jgi:hypothetical protein